MFCSTGYRLGICLVSVIMYILRSFAGKLALLIVVTFFYRKLSNCVLTLEVLYSGGKILKNGSSEDNLMLGTEPNDYPISNYVVNWKSIISIISLLSHL